MKLLIAALLLTSVSAFAADLSCSVDMKGLDSSLKSRLMRKGFIDDPSSSLKFSQKNKYNQSTGQEISLYSEATGEYLPAMKVETERYFYVNLKLTHQDEVIQTISGQGPDAYYAAEDAVAHVKSIKKLIKNYGVCL